ncbi:preprotein translocase subunit SecE [Thermodesulfobacteriota bacterium]
MKTTSQKKKKKGSKKSKRSGASPKVTAESKVAPSDSSKATTQKNLVTTQKKAPEKRRQDKGPKLGFLNVVMQFLREAKLELKKVKWPTRKELLASTAMVIFLILVISFYLGFIDFFLIKVLKLVVG